MNVRAHWLVWGLSLAAIAGTAAEPGAAGQANQFIGFDAFGSFATAQEAAPNETVLISPLLSSRIEFTELIASWNVVLPKQGYLIVEARAVYPQSSSRYYTLGEWSVDPAAHPRRSVAGQQDADGTVSTDTLVLRRPARQLQVRLTLGGTDSPGTRLKFLGLSLTATNAAPAPWAPCRQAWGKLIAVPERTQMIYPNGKTLCSPTTVSMLLAYWAQELKRPELDRPVPEIVTAIYDSQWQGTGNWPFNMAYAGSFPGIRAYVTRLTDIAELEAWIARGFPVGLSVDYDRLRAKGPGPNGHLVVLVGFTETGDPIINDPGTSQHVRKVFPRQNFLNAWACSHHTVYLVYPDNASLPADPHGHWFSRSGG